MITVTLPWPEAALSPNKRTRKGGFWPGQAAAKDARDLARITVKNEWVIVGSVFDVDTRLTISFIFHPPTRRHYDLDGLVSRCKAYQDGIFDALGNNDSQIDTIEARIKDVCKGGIVTIGVSESEVE